MLQIRLECSVIKPSGLISVDIKVRAQFHVLSEIVNTFFVKQLEYLSI